MHPLDIIVFEPRYTEQVKILLTSVLQYLDLPAVPEIERSSCDAPYDDSDLDRITEIYTQRSCFWLAIMEDTVVGMVAIEEVDTTEAHLRRMFVAPTFHGSGVSVLLLNTALDFARSQGYKVVTLDTHIGMKRAHNFYEKHGFCKTGEDARQRNYTRYI